MMTSYVRYSRPLLQIMRSGCFNSLPTISALKFYPSRTFHETRPSQCSRSDSKVSVLSTVPVDVDSTIRSLKDLEEISDFIIKNPKLDFQYYAPIFRTIFEAVKYKNSKSSIEEFVKSNEFEILCRNVKKNSRFLQPRTTMIILRTLISLGLSTNTILGQHLLQQLSKSVNKMDLKELMILRIILKNCASSPLVDGLIVALPVIFDSNARLQLTESPKVVADAIVFACEEQSVSKETYKFLFERACQIKDQFSVKEAYMIVAAFSHRHFDDSSQFSLYHDLLRIIIQDIDQISITQISYLLYSMLDLFCRADVNYYNEELVIKSIDCALSQKINFIMVGKFLRGCNKVSYPCISLLDYADDLLKDTEDFKKYRTIAPFLSFVTSCSDCSYRPKYFDTYENRLISLLDEYKSKPIPIVKTVLELTVLNCWDFGLIEHCFSDEFARQYVTRLGRKDEYNRVDLLNTLNLHQIVKTCYPGGYNGKELSKDILDTALKMVDEYEDFPLSGALTQGLGSCKYVLNGVRTNLGHFIDHLIVKRKNGELVVINESELETNSGITVESLKIPGDAFLIGIIVLKPSLYCLDGIKLRGIMKMILNSMEMLGIATIPVSKYAWIGLNDNEKIPYLMHKIDSRSPADAESIDAIL